MTPDECDEGGEAPCYAHLFEELMDGEPVEPPSEEADPATVDGG